MRRNLALGIQLALWLHGGILVNVPVRTNFPAKILPLSRPVSSKVHPRAFQLFDDLAAVFCPKLSDRCGNPRADPPQERSVLPELRFEAI